jgi:hypothetical protein
MMYSGGEYYGDDITSPLYRQLDRADGYEPTLILDCPSCHGWINFYGDGELDTRDHILTLPDFVTCDCGATFGAGDELEIIEE